MEKTENTHNEIPNILKIIGGILIALNALWIGLCCLAFLGTIFGINHILGFITLLTPLGWMLAIPVYLAFGSLSWFEINAKLTKFEYWTKISLIFVAAIVIPWVVYYLIILFERFILEFLYSFFK